MRKTVLGFLQDRAVAMGLKTDDLLFLDWFVYWYAVRESKMQTIIVGDQVYGWLNRSYAIQQLPIMSITNEDHLSTVLTKLVKNKTLKRVTRANDTGRGKKSFYAPGPNIKFLTGTMDNMILNDQDENEHLSQNKGESVDHLSESKGENQRPPLFFQRSDTESGFNTESGIDTESKQAIKRPIERTVFTKPSLQEVKDYCIERRNRVDAGRFIDHYESNGWMVGKTKMKDWRAAVRTWERNTFTNKEEPVRQPSKPLELDDITKEIIARARNASALNIAN